MKVIFVAGPYMGKNYNDIEEHIRAAEKFAVEIWNRGMAAFCPHLNTAHFEVKAQAPEASYKEFDLRMLRSCDAIFAVPGWQASAGAKAEVEEAQQLGIPVYYDLDQLSEAMGGVPRPTN